jgi:ABC-type branched-subunit amino acid transport system substrate-binding protein
MWDRWLTRRQLLALGGTALAANLLGGALAKEGPPVRIGAVLPERVERTGRRTDGYGIAGEAGRRGAILGSEDYGLDAYQPAGRNLDLLISSAPTGSAAFRAARRLAATEEIVALIGGFGMDQAQALSQVAEERNILFFNIGSPSDALRAGQCSRNTFHVEASAAMYLDALVASFVRSGFRRLFFTYAGSKEGEALYRRGIVAVEEHDAGAGEVGKAVVHPTAPSTIDAIADIAKARPDAVLLLMDWRSQLDFLGQYEAAGLRIPVTGFPEPVAQTREFFALSRDIARRSGAGQRVTLWEATLDANGAGELNDRFMSRWGEPLDPPAWAAYAAVKIIHESVNATGTLEGSELVEYLESPEAAFDVQKGSVVSFRPWDHQLRQPLYLVQIDPEAEWGMQLSRKLDFANLVEELPAHYPSEADAIERLDLFGDGPNESNCGF